MLAKRIVVTGAAGFIGSNVIRALNDAGYGNLILVDQLSGDGAGKGKEKNLEGVSYDHYFERDEFLEIVESRMLTDVEAIIHLGARTDTTEKDEGLLFQVNTRYSQVLFEYAVALGCRLLYASSAATYGNGSKGYNDEERNLQALNPYGHSKYLFDQFVLESQQKPPQWVGLKFFNVYGPHEEHKGFMASKIYHGFQEIEETGRIRLFRSYKEGCADGEQKRDFIYVKDVVSVVLFFLEQRDISGIFNVGTGKARTFLDLARALFSALGKTPEIEFIDMPVEISDSYQYFTEADISRLCATGYPCHTLHSLEEGVEEYVKEYLLRA